MSAECRRRGNERGLVVADRHDCDIIILPFTARLLLQRALNLAARFIDLARDGEGDNLADDLEVAFQRRLRADERHVDLQRRDALRGVNLLLKTTSLRELKL